MEIEVELDMMEELENAGFTESQIEQIMNVRAMKINKMEQKEYHITRTIARLNNYDAVIPLPKKWGFKHGDVVDVIVKKVE